MIQLIMQKRNFLSLSSAVPVVFCSVGAIHFITIELYPYRFACAFSMNSLFALSLSLTLDSIELICLFLQYKTIENKAVIECDGAMVKFYWNTVVYIIQPCHPTYVSVSRRLLDN